MGIEPLRVSQEHSRPVKRPLPQAHDIQVGDKLYLFSTVKSDAQTLHILPLIKDISAGDDSQGCWPLAVPFSSTSLVFLVALLAAACRSLVSRIL
jgi:hypothetical protein